jgi:exonuclease III
MHILTVNIRLTRAAANEGAFLPHARQNAHCVCLQETKVHVRPIGECDGVLPGQFTMGHAF